MDAHCPLFSVNDHSRNDQDKPNEERSSHGLMQKQNPQGHRDDWLKRVKGCAIGGAVGSQRPIPKEMAQRRADQADVEDRQDQGRGHVQSLAGDPVVCVSSREGEYGCNSHTDSGNLKGRVLFGQLLDVDRDVGLQDNREHAAENAKRSGGLLGRTDDDGRTQNGQNQGQDILFRICSPRIRTANMVMNTGLLELIREEKEPVENGIPSINAALARKYPLKPIKRKCLISSVLIRLKVRKPRAIRMTEDRKKRKNRSSKAGISFSTIPEAM